MKIEIKEDEEGVINTETDGEWECENLTQMIAELEIVKFYLLGVYNKRNLENDN